MNDKDIAANGSEPSRDGPDQKEDGPSTSLAEAQSHRPHLIDRMLGFFRPRNGGGTLREDLAEALAENGDGEDVFSPSERAMLNNILRLREVRVEDVMIPRADIDGVDITTTLGDLLLAFQESGHSRMPVYSESLDDPRGMVHIRDVLNHITRSAQATASETGVPEPKTKVSGADLGRVDLAQTIEQLDLIRTILFVPSSMLASDLMARMQAAHIQIALVIDEYGGTDGLASLEDIVEMVVGDIEDEHDEEENPIVETSEGIYVADAKVELDDVAAFIPGFLAGEHGEDVDTLAGLIFNALGRVPARGEVVSVVPGFEIHILEADPRRVKKVRFVRLRGSRAEGDPGEDLPPLARSA